MRFRREFYAGSVELEMNEGDDGNRCRPFDPKDPRFYGSGAPEQGLSICWHGQYVRLVGPRELMIEVARGIFEAYRVPPDPVRVQVVVTQARLPVAPPPVASPVDPERAELEAIKRGFTGK